MDKTFFEKISPNLQKLHDQEYIHKVHVDVLRELYEAKCVDNKHDPNENQFWYFLDRFKRKSKKRILEFTEQSIGPRAGEVLAKIIEDDKHFVRLHLSKNFIGDESIILIAEALKKNKQVVHVDISSNNFGPKGSKAMFQMLAHNITIVSMLMHSYEGLYRNKIEPKGIKHVKEVFLNNKTLQILDVSNAYLTWAGCDIILKALDKNEYLVSLNLSNSGIPPEAGFEMAKVIARSNLEALYLANNNLGDEGTTHLMQMFRLITYKIAKLEILDLSNNNICVAVAKMFEILTRNNTMQKLILDHNNFSGKPFSTVTEFLSENVRITHLSLKGCQIGGESADYLAQGLQKNKVLVNLNIADNSLTDKGAVDICEALHEHPALREIDMQHCWIHDPAGEAVAELLNKNRRIRTIELKDNIFYDDTGLSLMNAVKNNKAISKISLDRNPVSLRFVTEIYKSLEINRNQARIRRHEEMRGLMKELKDFEKEKDSVTSQTKKLLFLEGEAKKNLDRQKGVLKEIERVEDQRYEIMETELSQVWVDYRGLERKNDDLDAEIRRTRMEIWQAEHALVHLEAKNASELKKIEDKILIVRDEMRIISGKFEKDFSKVKREFENESSKYSKIEESYKAIAKKINILKDAARAEEQRLAEEEAKRNSIVEKPNQVPSMNLKKGRLSKLEKTDKTEKSARSKSSNGK